MPKDNFETSPALVVARRKGDVARLNMEIALLPSDNATEQQGGGSAAASTNLATGLVTAGGGGVPSPPCFTGDMTLCVKVERRGSFMIDFIPFSRVKEGDQVMAFNPETRQIVWAEVEAVMIHETTEFLRMELDNGRALNVTEEHLMFDGHDFKPARDFAVLDWFYTDQFCVTEIRNIYRVTVDSPVLVYNIQTSSQTYFAHGIAVHNAKAAPEI